MNQTRARKRSSDVLCRHKRRDGIIAVTNNQQRRAGVDSEVAVVDFFGADAPHATAEDVGHACFAEERRDGVVGVDYRCV